ncbi:MAG: choice-of-anchor Q domain-containing protein [Panacagrimonas sp.]
MSRHSNNPTPAPRVRLNAFASAIAAGLFALPSAPALAATIDVGGACTLVDAITAANTDAAVGGCAGGAAGLDTIVLPANSTQTLTAVDNTSYGPTGLPVIAGETLIQGNGSTIQRSSAEAFRIFAVNSSGNLSLQGTTVSGGLATVSGGGIASYGGALSLARSTLFGNSAANLGGGVFIAGGTAVISRSTITGNGAQDGGGIFNDSPNMSVIDSMISGNVCGDDGGGIYNGDTMSLLNSTVSGNAAGDDGGAIYNDGSLTVVNSTLSANRAGVYDPGGDGGGIYNERVLSLIHSTVTGNTAVSDGGGLYVEQGSVLTMQRSLVSGNFATNLGDEIRRVTGGTIVANASNVFSHSAVVNADAFRNFTPGASDRNASSNGNIPTPLSDILDVTLADNGGPTRTHALVAGSPAIDIVAGSLCAGTTDQRGVNRPKGAGCDAGAFEVGVNTADLSILKTASAPNALVGASISFTLAVSNNGPENATDVQVFDTLPAQLGFVSVTPNMGSCTQDLGTIACELGNLASGASASISVVTTANTAGTADNTASIISAPIIDFDPDTSNNASTASVSIAAIDTAPDAFSFTDQTGVPLNSQRTSDIVTITGINTPAPISVVGGQFSIGCTGTFTATATTISSGQTVCVRHTSSSLGSTATNTTLTVGGVSDTFTSTTVVVLANSSLSVASVPMVILTQGLQLRIILSPTATLRDTGTNQPIVGRTVSFSAGATPLCTAVTSTSGVAMCQANLINTLAGILSLGYTARFNGDATYLPSIGMGGILGLRLF